VRHGDVAQEFRQLAEGGGTSTSARHDLGGGARAVERPIARGRRLRRLRLEHLYRPNDQTFIDVHDAVNGTIFRAHEHNTTGWRHANENAAL